MSLEILLNDIAAAAGYQIGQTYSAEAVVQHLRNQGRQYGDEKIAELIRERDKLQAAMLDCRHQLMTLSSGTEGHLRGRICTASNILSRALGLTESSHGEKPAENEDFEAQKRLAEQSEARD